LDNAQLYAGYQRIADEQAALRRVATLVARAEPPEAVFAAVAAEAGQRTRAHCWSPRWSERWTRGPRS
ncbi:MAG TPA: hypothetical protein VGL33_20045, partial [Streptosporangiaceae bacterium]